VNESQKGRKKRPRKRLSAEATAVKEKMERELRITEAEIRMLERQGSFMMNPDEPPLLIRATV